MKRTPMFGLTAFAALALALPAPAAFHQDDEKEGEEAEAEAEAEAEDSGPAWFAVTGGDVYTGTGSVLRGATILCKDGQIDEIGYDLRLPEDTETLDATGYRIYPGLIAVSSFGLFGGSSDLENSIDPFGQNLVLALGTGITSALTSNEVGKLKYGEIKDIVVKDNVFRYLSYSKSNPAGKRTLRSNFEEAVTYLEELAQFEIDKKTDKDLKEPSKSGIDSNVVAVLQGQYRPVFRAGERTDLLEIARLAQRFGFRPIIQGCEEGWTVADELGRAGAAAIITPRARRGKSEALVSDAGSSIENAAILHAAGVPVTIIPGSAGISLGGIVGRDLMHLPIEAGFAVRGGLSEEAALAGITLEPARLMGIQHRVGSLEVGKDADMIICDGDVLHYQTFVQWAVVEGKVAYDKEAHLYFAHIR
ncbi:MAG: amidohydrolase family protein, partial [Planctomycetota bacterium]|nr:amidohydrolase family protein [Planctomycetota bacterium]